MSTASATRDLDAFIARWAASGAAERANFQGFAYELCAVLDVPPPEPTVPDDTHNAYVFERAVTFSNPDGTTSAGRIDLYRRGAFVMEAKQGSDGGEATQARAIDNATADVERAAASIRTPKSATRNRRGTAVRGTTGWTDAMMAARGQAEQYVRALPADEGNPPFVVVVDVGHSIELYSDFTRSGKTYVPFPDARNHRIMLRELASSEVRERLRAIWLDPMSLDPSRRAAKVTREVADRLARLARSLEQSGHAPEAVAQFLMRCIFTMFAEDVKLIPERAFTELLEDLRQDVAAFPDNMRALWSDMDRGGFSGILRRKLLRFNGGLFESVEALPLTREQLDLLIDAGKSDWHDVEPAIFGTLLERALDPVERHKLGAHYTPRAYVERLVMPTIVEPLREEWDATRAATVALMNAGDRDEAVKELRTFHHRLCTTKVLDPACGTGNFLYVTLEHLKRLEGEVLDLLGQLGESNQALELTELTVDPHQLLGIEINPRAAAIADLVLWIGYLQWHFRTHGDAQPREPVLHKYNNIENRDALLDYDAIEPQLDEHGEPITRWDGRTTKKHPVTGEDVPDDTARVPVMRYVNPRKAEWPEAEFIVGNPPFIGNKRMRTLLGDGYVESLREIFEELSESVELVMYWWQRSAEQVAAGASRRFGLVTTNSITQAFNRKVIAAHTDGGGRLSIRFAIPDHPWIDADQGAAVRIAMTVADESPGIGVLATLAKEQRDGQIVALIRRSGVVHPNLAIGTNVLAATGLASNGGLVSRGVTLVGRGFLLSREQRDQLLAKDHRCEQHIRPFMSGRDIVQSNRGLSVIDLFGSDVETVRTGCPEVYQWLLERVKPERDANNRESYRKRWWVFAEPRGTFRPALDGLDRFVVTSRTSRHRTFGFARANTIVESEVVAIASSTASVLGILSSVLHVVWSRATGARLGVGNDGRYSIESFETFPFPPETTGMQRRIGQSAEQLDAHRKRQQALHPTLTITDMYNVLEKLRSGEALTAKEKRIHEEGLVSVLKEIHDELDHAVLEAYGWGDLIPLLAYDRREEFEEKILERLVALNHERAEEEKRGIVRWLRPEFQARDQQGAMEIEEAAPAIAKARGKSASEPAKTAKQPWPATVREQTQAVRSLLASAGSVMTADEIAKRFTGVRTDRLGDVLDTLASLGAVRRVGDDRFVA